MTDAELQVILRLIADTRAADQVRTSLRGVSTEAQGAARWDSRTGGYLAAPVAGGKD